MFLNFGLEDHRTQEKVERDRELNLLEAARDTKLVFWVKFHLYWTQKFSVNHFQASIETDIYTTCLFCRRELVHLHFPCSAIWSFRFNLASKSEIENGTIFFSRPKAEKIRKCPFNPLSQKFCRGAPGMRPPVGYQTWTQLVSNRSFLTNSWSFLTQKVVKTCQNVVHFDPS